MLKVDVENASIDEHAHISPENSSNDHAPAEDGASNTPTKKQSHFEFETFLSKEFAPYHYHYH